MKVECIDRPRELTVEYWRGAAHQRSSSGLAGAIDAWTSTVRNRDASRVQNPMARPWLNRQGAMSASATSTRRFGLNRANSRLKGTSSTAGVPHQTACRMPISR